MEITNIREKLHQFINTIENKKAEAIYTLFKDEIVTDLNRRKLILAERQKYLSGEGKPCSRKK